MRRVKPISHAEVKTKSAKVLLVSVVFLRLFTSVLAERKGLQTAACLKPLACRVARARAHTHTHTHTPASP